MAYLHMPDAATIKKLNKADLMAEVRKRCTVYESELKKEHDASIAYHTNLAEKIETLVAGHGADLDTYDSSGKTGTYRGGYFVAHKDPFVAAIQHALLRYKNGNDELKPLQEDKNK